MSSRRVSGDAHALPKITSAPATPTIPEDSIALPPLVSAVQQHAATACESLEYDLLQLNLPEHGSFAEEFVANKYSLARARLGSKEAAAGDAVTAFTQSSKQKPHSRPHDWEREPSTDQCERLPKGDSLKFVYSPPVWPHERILSKNLDKLLLRNLMLDDSSLNCLRDLGSSLPNIVTLSVMRCKLKSLDGASGLPNLENLFAADNHVSTPSPLAYLEKIRYVDLSGNEISEFEGFRFLSACAQLQCLKLVDTVLARRKDFHQRLKGMIPSLRELHPIPSLVRDRDAALAEEDFLDDFGLATAGITTESLFETVDVSSALTMASATDTDNDLAREEILSKQLDLKLEYEWAVISGMFDEESEQRLRDVNRPEKRNFKLRGSSSAVPTTIEEMDALMEDLDDKQQAKEERRRRRQQPVNSSAKAEAEAEFVQSASSGRSLQEDEWSVGSNRGSS